MKGAPKQVEKVAVGSDNALLGSGHLCGVAGEK